MDNKVSPPGRYASSLRHTTKQPILPDVDVFVSSSSSVKPIKNHQPSTVSKGMRVPNNNPIPESGMHRLKPREIEPKGDPLLDRLAQRFPATFDKQRRERKPQEYHVEFLGVNDSKPQVDQKRSGIPPSKAAVATVPAHANEKIDYFVGSLQDEAASIVARHLPDAVKPPPGDAFFSSSPPYNLILVPPGESNEESGTRTMPFVVDDRITPSTVHALLKKGRTLASRVLKGETRRDLGRVIKTNTNVGKVKCDALYKSVARLEPPSVEQIMQARVRTDQGTVDTATHLSMMRSLPTDHTVKASPSPVGDSELDVEKVLERSEASNMVLNAAITRSTCAGDDAGIIAQVLAHVSDPERAKSAGEISNVSSVFSALNAVLSVSKDFEKMRQSWSDDIAGEKPGAIHAIIERLTSVESSRVPHTMWVSANRPTFSTSTLAEKDEEAAKPTSGLLFPAANPRGRAQVYLLADALDRMAERKPDAFKVLSDRKLAEQLLPLDLSKDNRTVAERLINPDAVQASDEVHMQYVDAAEHMMNLIDVGLVEIVRQTACVCAERGALLDLLRLVTSDLLSSCLHLVKHCKETARREAKARRDIISSSRKDVEGVVLLREEVREAKREAAALRNANEDLETRAGKYDTLIERLKLKDHNFLRHSADKHLELLMELESGFTNSTSKGLEALYRVTQTEGDEKICDTPTTQMNQMKEKEKQAIQQDLYTESYKLLGALTNTLDAVDAACRPLYDELELPKHAMASNVAMSRWAEIARAVGMQEADKKHRRRVFEVFTQCNNDPNAFPAMNEQGEKPLSSIILSPNAPISPVSQATPRQTPIPISTEETGLMQGRSSVSPDVTSQIANPLSTQGSGNTLQTLRDQPPSRRKLVTNEDLAKMGVTDCTPEEINALYDVNFDIAGYLGPTYQPLPDHTIELTEIKSMLHDVTECLKHVTLRMGMMMNSAFLRESMKPPKKPPSRPEDPCGLCGRRDRVAMEKKSKGEVMQRLANEIQRRYDEVVLKCQRAEAEREDLRRRVKRLEIAERKKLADWTRREEELQRSKKLLEEENRVLTMQISLEMAPTRVGDNQSNSSSSHSSDSEGTASFGSEGFS